MKRSKGAKLIERVAAAHRVSIAEVRLEIQKSIDIAFETKDKDIFQKGFWDKWGGRKPTPEEFIAATSKKAQDVLDFNALMKQ